MAAVTDVRRICKQLAGKTKPGAMVISLIKGMRVRPEGPQLISSMVQRYLNADCSVLMGANIAADTAQEQVRVRGPRAAAVGGGAGPKVLAPGTAMCAALLPEPRRAQPSDSCACAGTSGLRLPRRGSAHIARAALVHGRTRAAERGGDWLQQHGQRQGVEEAV